MLTKVSERMVSGLIREGILDAGKRDVYIYGMLVILLNGSVMISTMLFSAFTHTMRHYVLFVCAFCPLRVYAGGYHARRAGDCFICSNCLYIAAVCVCRLWEVYGTNGFTYGMLVIGLIAACSVFRTGTIERRGAYVSEGRHRKHIKILNRILLADLVAACAMYMMSFPGYQMVVISVILVAALQGWVRRKTPKGAVS